MPGYGRCRGCGERVLIDHGTDGSWGHTVSAHALSCQGDGESCDWCPEPVACGPIEPPTASVIVLPVCPGCSEEYMEEIRHEPPLCDAEPSLATPPTAQPGGSSEGEA
jgi:hypothetical protein